MVEVPSVAYKTAEAATEILEEKGFEVKVVYSNNLLGLVYNTDPSAGTEAPEGSTVTVYVT